VMTLPDIRVERVAPRVLGLLAAAAVVAGVHGCAEGQSGLTIGTGAPLSLDLQESGESWTIECTVDRSPQRVAAVDRLSGLMRKTNGIRSDQVKVIHGTDVSTLYYGTYYLKPDARGQGSFPPQMNRDMQFIRQLTSPDNPGRRLFAGARRVPDIKPDEGPREWDLRLASGAFTLQIAVFYNTEEFHERKKAAVEYCKYWRDKGYDAYYYHGPRLSSTTVGIFQEEAVKQVAGRPVYAENVIAFQKKEPEFSWSLQNGQHIYLRRDGQRVAQSSYLVKLPSNATPNDS
jgi:hypothetical protein